jgi:hypothetical protein
MKRFYILFLLVAFSFAAFAQLHYRIKDCAYVHRPEIKLSGNVKVVKKGPATFRVRVIPEDSKEPANVYVKIVSRSYHNNECGSWCFMKADEKYEDFTVKWVGQDEDFTIRFVKDGEMQGSL